MYTPLKKTALHDLLNKPILFDANIFMVGISERTSDKNYSFENIKRLYIKPLFESFTDIYIHEEVLDFQTTCVRFGQSSSKMLLLHSNG